ncbi:MAG: hypothetical protein P8Q48_23135 [Paracoccaceae bacterium]|jgi:hypothetical protein|nr:hypothetical protein [Paracoccaceae bacterium]MDG1373088.1 hypothetical protein [Paracoccaceae bacterium]
MAKTIEQRIIERYDYDISDIVENRDDVFINGSIIHVGGILCIPPKMNGTPIVSIFDSKCNISNQNGALDMETPDNHPIAVGRSVIFFSCLRALKTARQATPTKSLEEIELCARFEARIVSSPSFENLGMLSFGARELFDLTFDGRQPQYNLFGVSTLASNALMSLDFQFLLK